VKVEKQSKNLLQEAIFAKKSIFTATTLLIFENKKKVEVGRAPINLKSWSMFGKSCVSTIGEAENFLPIFSINIETSLIITHSPLHYHHPHPHPLHQSTIFI